MQTKTKGNASKVTRCLVWQSTVGRVPRQGMPLVTHLLGDAPVVLFSKVIPSMYREGLCHNTTPSR